MTAAGVVMTHGAPYGSRAYDDVDHVAVPSLLEALDGREVRVVLMSSTGVTGAADGLLAWKRRGERLLRASGLPHAVVRPGWFDAGSGAEQRVDLRQGDATEYGPVRREHVAEALVRALTAPEAVGRTVEVFSVDEPPVEDWGSTVAALDGALDPPGPPPAAEPARVRGDLERWGRRGS